MLTHNITLGEEEGNGLLQKSFQGYSSRAQIDSQIVVQGTSSHHIITNHHLFSHFRGHLSTSVGTNQEYR